MGELYMQTEYLDIFYIRHADAEKGLTGSRDKCDRDLTELGEKQLVYLAKRFEGASFDAVLSSPLVRTVKTAAAVAGALQNKPQIEIVPELIERGATPGYGGIGVEALKEYYPEIVMCKDNIFGGEGVDFPNEVKADALERAKAVIEYLLKRFNYGQKIAVVSHGAFGINFYQAAMGIFNDYDFRMTTHNTAVTKLRFQSDGVRRISFSNDVSHLLPIMPDYQFEF